MMKARFGFAPIIAKPGPVFQAQPADFAAMHRRYRYETTPANAERAPVRTVSTHSAFTLGSNCDFPELDGLSCPDDQDQSGDAHSS